MDFLKELEFISNEESNTVLLTVLLDELADNKNILIVEAVSKNIHTSSATLDKLSKCNSTQVLLNVANNPNTDINTLESMYGIGQHQWVNNIIKDKLKDSHSFDSEAWNRGDYKNIITRKKAC